MKNSILFVYAHPDDETFTAGITISKYAQETDAAIHVVSATRGQAGKPGNPPLCTVEELPQVRERELREACAILGVTTVELWDYEDKKLDQVPVSELAAHVHAAIARLRPQAVVTFAPHGISGHPDHKAISAAVTQAIQTLPEGSPVRKLYYATRASDRTFGAIQPVFGDPYDAITTIIQAPAYTRQVGMALRAHRTQHLSVERVFPGVPAGDYSNVPDQNHFILAWNNIPGYTISGKEHDVFAGIE